MALPHRVPISRKLPSYVQPLFDHHQPSRYCCAVPRRQPLCRQPRADAGRLRRTTGAVMRQTLMRRSMPDRHRAGGPPVTNIRNTSSPHWRGVAQAGEPLHGPGQQLRRVLAGAEPGDRRKRTSSGSRSTTTAHCTSSPASGRRSTVIAALSRSRYRGRITSTVFSRHRRTRWSSRSIRRPCR